MFPPPAVQADIPQASSQYQTIRELLQASLKPHAQIHTHQVFHFADPAFAGFLIRITQNITDALNATTSLTPPEWIFHGPHIGGTLLEGHDASDRHHTHNGISIVLEQAGLSFADIVKTLGTSELVRLLAENPEKLERLFRIVAFTGAHKQTTLLDTSASAELWGGSLDLHDGNMFIDADGNLSLIDQMSPEDHAKTAHLDDEMDYPKAMASVTRLDAILNSYLRTARCSKRLDQHLLERLQETIYKNSDDMFKVLEAAELKPSRSDAWAYLRTNLSDKGTEEWRGVEAPGPVFDKTNSTAAGAAIPLDRLDIDRDSPQDLLNLLHAMRDKTLSL